jgi:prevent-host-death family protein
MNDMNVTATNLRRKLHEALQHVAQGGRVNITLHGKVKAVLQPPTKEDGGFEAIKARLDELTGAGPQSVQEAVQKYTAENVDADGRHIDGAPAEDHAPAAPPAAPALRLITDL